MKLILDPSGGKFNVFKLNCTFYHFKVRDVGMVASFPLSRRLHDLINDNPIDEHIGSRFSERKCKIVNSKIN